MKKRFCLTLTALTLYLTVGTLQSAGAATHPLAQNRTHIRGVSDDWVAKRHKDRHPNRRYARSFAANLNVGQPRTVRLIYFLPSDRSPQQDIDTKLDTLIKDVQQFYADEMERYGFGQKTFTFETDATGKAVVHHVEGQFTDSYYRQNTFRKVWDEIREQFYTPHNIYFIAIDIGNERVGRGDNEVCGVGDSHGASGGHVLIPASGDCFNLKTAAHELGHAFGLQHDFRSDTYIMSFGRNPNTLSECAAEWLDAHRYFNTGQSQTHFDNPTKIQMLTPLASPPHAIGLRFEVTDPDGVHQAQLLTPATIRKQERWQSKLLSCKRLNGETDPIEIEFITNQLKVKSEYDGEGVSLSVEVILSVIDVYGNFTSQTYPIDLATILPTETASTPNKNRSINILEPVPPPLAVRQAFELDPFYQQWTDVEGFPVVASEKVSPYALKEAAWLIWQMIGHRPEMLHTFVQKRVRFVVIGHTEIPTDIPDYSDEGPDFLTYRQRGFGGGGLSGHTAVSSSEEDLLHYPGSGGSHTILIHEFAHAIHRYGLNTVDPTFNDRLQITYDAAMEKGLWQGTYASTDRGEYWAEATQVWFHPKGAASFRNYGNTRDALKAYDPGIAALLAEVYGDTEWRYTPPAVRLHLPHLQGFNPQDSPTFQGFPELEELYRQFSDPNSDGGDNWVDLRPYDPSLIPILNESRTRGAGSRLAYLNLTQADVLLYRVRYDGTERFRRRVPSGDFLWSGPRANKLQLIKDLNGRNLAVFQPVEKTGRILIDETLNLITPGLSKISGDNQAGVSGTALPKPFVVEVRDENLSVLKGISVTFAVVVGTGTLNATRTTTDEKGAAQSTLTLGPNLGTNTVSVSAVGIEGTVTFNAMVEAAVNIPAPNLRAKIETALSKAGGDPITPSEMAALTRLEARSANIGDLTGLEHATNLRHLVLYINKISDPSPVAGLTDLTYLNLAENSISDISALVNLTNLTYLELPFNSISNLSPLVANTGLGSGDEVDVRGNPLSYVSIYTHIPTLQSRGIAVEFNTRKVDRPLKISGDDQQGTVGTVLTDPFVVEVRDRKGAVFAGVPVTFAVTAGGGTLSVTQTITDKNGQAKSTLTLGPRPGTNGVAVSAAGTKGQVIFNAISNPLTTEYLWSIPAGTSLIHVPLKVSAVDGVAKTIRSIGDLYDAIGGALTINFLVTYDPSTQEWLSYFGTADRGSPGDKALTDDTGIVAGMKTPVSVQLTGVGLGIDENSTMTLHQGLNLVGLPLNNSSITHVSDLFALEGIRNNVPVIILTVGGDFQSVGRPGDPADIPITAGQGFILTAQQPATVTLSGDAWTNASGSAAAPSLGGIAGRNTTPVLALRGVVVDEETGANEAGFRVSVKNLSAGRTSAAITAPDEAGYRFILVDIATGQAATIGDTLEISAQSKNPFIGVHPLRYIITAEDVKQSLILLPALVAYEIPTETELLANYPNPFNPETWIPYQLTEPADVTLTIYDANGGAVRRLDLGYQLAGYYTDKTKAAYWDGKNAGGEQVASGVYFYHLKAGDYSQTQKMLILK